MGVGRSGKEVRRSAAAIDRGGKARAWVRSERDVQASTVPKGRAGPATGVHVVPRGRTEEVIRSARLQTGGKRARHLEAVHLQPVTVDELQHFFSVLLYASRNKVKQ